MRQSVAASSKAIISSLLGSLPPPDEATRKVRLTQSTSLVSDPYRASYVGGRGDAYRTHDVLGTPALDP
jgi:hypothetical protein